MATEIKTFFPVHDRLGQLFHAEDVKVLLNIEVYLKHFSSKFLLFSKWRHFKKETKLLSVLWVKVSVAQASPLLLIVLLQFFLNKIHLNFPRNSFFQCEMNAF